MPGASTTFWWRTARRCCSLIFLLLFACAGPAGNIRYYGTTEKPAQHGTLYDFIDGAAVLFYDHGCLGARQETRRDSAGQPINLEIYEMPHPDSARVLFNHPDLRTQEDRSINIGEKGVFFHPAPNFVIEYFRANYYIRVFAADDRSRPAAEALARETDRRIMHGLD